jgi:hypothetical protein
MDNRKIDEILARERPKHKKLESYQDESLVGSDEARDVDVKNLPVSAWKKQPVQAAPRDSDYPAAKEKPMTPKKTGGSSIDELRERFRPRKRGQRGGDADSPARGARPPESGKIALRRLKMGPEGGDDESSMDVLIDEDDGIIGESDSGPEGKIRKK